MTSLAESVIREADEVLDVIKSKGASLEGYRREYTELINSIESVSEITVEKEREIEALHTDSIQIRDQTANAKRNIEETMLSLDGLQSNLDSLRENRVRLMEREMSNRSKITMYSSKFDKLHEAIEVGSGWTPAQDEERQALEKERDFLSKKLDNKNNIVAGVRLDVDRCYETIQTLETDISKITTDVDRVQKEVNSLGERSEEQQARCRLLELKVKTTQQENVQAEEDYHSRRLQLKSEDKTLHSLEKSLKYLKAKMDNYISEYDGLYLVTQNLSSELEKHKSLNRSCEAESEQRRSYIAARELEIEEAEKEVIKYKKLRDVAMEKIEQIDALKNSFDEKRDKLQKDLDHSRDHDLKHVRKQNEALMKQRSQLASELEVLNKKSLNSDKAYKAIQDLTFVNQNTLRNLTLEKKLLMDEVAVQYRQIQLLLQEKEKHEHDTEITNQEYYTALEELKLQELQVRELQKKISDDQAKLKHKQNLYEAVRADRNLYNKQLIDSQDEIATLKRKFRLTNHQIDQIKEEISSKDHAIVKEHFHHHSVDKERELLKNELTKIRKQVLSSEQIIENQHVEVLKLTRIIEEADLERQRQNNELIAIISERNLLTAQVVKRNSELSEMYDKIKIQRSNLRIGERHYSSVLAKLNDLREQLVSVVRENNTTISELGILEDLKRRAIRLEKSVLQEQSKKQALTGELSRPMNVHRWRVLESSDPQRFEKIRQIQSLQKELIEKSDEVIERDLLIQEKEKVYVELKNIISRQPGPEVEEQVMTYQLTLKDKTKQLSSMNNELEMYRLQVQTFKDEIITIDNTIAGLKKTWKKSKRHQTAMIQ
jgi:chromosome segregation ATPase